MPAPKRKWSRHVHLKSGGMKGWCALCPAARRRRAISAVVRADGYATAVRRLNFLRNVSNRRSNRKLYNVATRDITWMKRRWGDSTGAR